MSSAISSLQFRDLTLDAATRQLRRGEEPIALPAKAFDLLLYMVENAGRPLLKTELLAAVWPDSFVEEANLSQNVFMLRKTLGGSVEGAIVTLPGRGYQFTAAVHALTPTTDLPQTLQATATHVIYEEETEDSLAFWRSPLLLAGTAIGIVAIALAGWLGWQRYEDRVGGPPVQVILSDLDGTTGDPILDHALTDAIRIDLNQSPFVSVVSANTVRRRLAEMMHKADEPLTATLARDLCERTSSQAVLHGSIAHFGSKYLLTEEATNCVDGAILASAKREAGTKDELPSAIDTLTSTLRHGLGESRRTITRFSAPLIAENTGSIEALKAYSQSLYFAQHGKMPDSIALAKQAVDLDPKFAAAWLHLAAMSGNAGDDAGQRAYIVKAYELRALASEPTRLNIIALYNNSITGNLYETLANFKTWAALYPNSSIPWSGLTQTNRELGFHADAVVAGKRALELNSHAITPYYALALEQLHAGDPQAARATCELSLSRGLDGDVIHGVLLRVAIVSGDASLRDAQLTWLQAHPDATYMLTSEASRAQAEGRFVDARQWLDRVAEAYRRQSLQEAADATWRLSTVSWIAMDDMADARLAIQHGNIDPEEPFDLLALAALGQSAQAAALMGTQLSKHPQATLTNRVFAPWLRAQTASYNHRPAEAFAELDRIRPFDDISLSIRYDRAMALLENNQFPEAAIAFHEVLTHSYIDALSECVPLAWLNLGRTLSKQNKSTEARDAYNHFFQLWAHANGDPLLLTRAKAEAAKLP